MPPDNPFQYTRATLPPEFVGRQFLIDALLGGVQRRTSVLLVGATRSGRTSILRYLEDRLRSAVAGTLPLYLDAQTLAEEAEEKDFWRHILRHAPNRTALASAGYAFEAVEDLLADLADRSILPVLLIDHIDAILALPQLSRKTFLGRLRAISCGHAAIPIIATSEVSATRINSLLPHDYLGSPFNHMLEYVLGPVDRADIEALLTRAGDRFSAEDMDFIIKISSCHLYLAQVLAGCLWVFNANTRATGPERRVGAGREALHIIEATIDTRWRRWSLGDRTLILTLALADLGGPRSAAGDGSTPSSAPAHQPQTGAVHDLFGLLKTAYTVAELRSLMTRLSETPLDSSLPGAAATGDEVYESAANIVMRHRVAEPLIHELVRERPRLHVEIHQVARALGIHNVAVSFGQGLVTIPDYRGLVRSGVLADEGSSMGLRSPMLLWWLIDRLRPLARGDASAAEWFASMELGGNSMALNGSLHAAILAIRARLLQGALPFIREAAQ